MLPWQWIHTFITLLSENILYSYLPRKFFTMTTMNYLMTFLLEEVSNLYLIHLFLRLTPFYTINGCCGNKEIAS